VKHHLANARSKVGAETTAQLVWILAPRLPEPEAGRTAPQVSVLTTLPAAMTGRASPAKAAVGDKPVFA
jgi:hypothetical protein